MTLFSWFDNNQDEESAFTLSRQSSTLTYKNIAMWPVARVKVNSSSTVDNIDKQLDAIPKSMNS